jgi:hypothetical protein
MASKKTPVSAKQSSLLTFFKPSPVSPNSAPQATPKAHDASFSGSPHVAENSTS